MEPNNLIGKTIKEINTELHHVIDIVFTDGTEATFEADTDHGEPIIDISVNEAPKDKKEYIVGIAADSAKKGEFVQLIPANQYQTVY